MTPQKQKYKHNPEIGHYGDCDRTTIACILNIPRDDVPNWAELFWPTNDTEGWEKAKKQWLKARGFGIVTMYYHDCEPSEILNYVGHFNQDVYWLLTGMSKNKTNHVVICKGNQIVWDTAIDDSGIVGPTSDSFYYVDFIVPSVCVDTVEGMPYGTYGKGY